MLKKYVPYFALLLAAFLLYFIKKNQHGTYSPSTNTEHVTVPAVVGPSTANEDGINRHPSKLIYSRHARCRMECRHIDDSEVQEILASGVLNSKKIEEDSRGTTYPLEGVTHDKQHVRIVFAPKPDNEMEVVTCIDLDTDWPCDCK